MEISIIELKKIYKEAIDHYERMIKYAMNQKPNTELSPKRMENDIEEDWFGKDCSYCKKFQIKIDNNLTCYYCPLTSTPEEEYCCNGHWRNMNGSPTVEEWIINAQKVLQYIKENGCNYELLNLWVTPMGKAHGFIELVEYKDKYYYVCNNICGKDYDFVITNEQKVLIDIDMNNGKSGLKHIEKENI